MKALPSTISFSQLSTYAGCGERYRLERLVRVPRGTWWATILGSALHEVTEWWDQTRETSHEVGLEDATDWMLDRFHAIAAEEAKKHVIHASGRVLKAPGFGGGPRKKDDAWCEEWGPKFLAQYIAWRKSSGWRIATLDGKLGIELAVDVDIVADEATGELLPVRGVIDRVFQIPLRKSLRVLDIKSGKVPTSKLQLVTYAAALGVLYPDTRVGDAAYWTPGSEDSKTDVFPISKWGQDYLWGLYSEARKGMEAGVFLPNITDMCKGCLVRDYCWAYSGDKALELTELTTGAQAA